MRVTWDRIHGLALALRDVEDGTSYGTLARKHMGEIMKAALAVVLITVFAASAFAECGATLYQSTFGIVSVCTAEKPCVRGKPVTFELRTDTSCRYNPYACAPYTIGECDVVHWAFGDGAIVTVTGSARVEHLFPGTHAQATAVIQNDLSTTSATGKSLPLGADPPVYVRWEAKEVATTENAGAFTVDLVRSGNLDRTVQVLVSEDPSVRVHKDDSLSTKIFDFAAGQTRVPVTLHPYDNGVFRGDGLHFVTLLPDPDDTVILGDYEYQSILGVYVAEDEPGPAAHISMVEILEGNGNAPQTIEIPVILSQPLSLDLRLRSDDPALRGTTIAQGETRGTLLFTWLPDGSLEDDETITIPLWKPAHEITFGGPPQVTVRIRDDDVYRLAPAATTVRARTSSEVIVGRAAPDAQVLVAELESSDPTVVAIVPQRIAIPPLHREIAFSVRALRAGIVTITARFHDGNVATNTIHVVDQPSITSVTPSIGRTGDLVRIDGANLSPECGVTFDGVQAVVSSLAGGALNVFVPALSPYVTTYDVTVNCAGGPARLRDAFRRQPRRRSATSPP